MPFLNNEISYQYYWVTQQSIKIRNHIKGPPADSAADKAGVDLLQIDRSQGGESGHENQ